VAVDRRRLSDNDRAQETDGLMLMAHRAQLIGAELNIRSPRRAGAQVTCRLPI